MCALCNLKNNSFWLHYAHVHYLEMLIISISFLFFRLGHRWAGAVSWNQTRVGKSKVKKGRDENIPQLLVGWKKERMKERTEQKTGRPGRWWLREKKGWRGRVGWPDSRSVWQQYDYSDTLIWESSPLWFSLLISSSLCPKYPQRLTKNTNINIYHNRVSTSNIS